MGHPTAFLRALLDVANDVPNVSLLVVMIASDVDTTALSPAGRDRRDDPNSLLERDGLPATVTEVADFASILPRRLFNGQPVRKSSPRPRRCSNPYLSTKRGQRTSGMPSRRAGASDGTPR